MTKCKYTRVSGGMVILFLIILLFQPALTLSPGDKNKKEKEDTLRQIKYLLFLSKNNLYDGRLLLQLKDEIGLTREQEKKIEDLMLEHEAFSIRNSAEIKIKELQFASYLKSEKKKIDRKQMERLIREISNEKTTKIIHYINYLLDLRELLTPQQMEILRHQRNHKLQDIKEKHKKKRMEAREGEGHQSLGM
jgi:Spy/CpxP family protein refolding chaperone